MAVFLKVDPARRKRTLGVGAGASNPNVLVNYEDNGDSYGSRMMRGRDPRSIRKAAEGRAHLVRHSCEEVIELLREKICERNALGPSGMRRAFASLDRDGSGESKSPHLLRFLPFSVGAPGRS